MDARETSASHRVDCVGVLWQAFPGDHRLDHRVVAGLPGAGAASLPGSRRSLPASAAGRQAAARTMISLERTGSTYFHCRGLKPAASISFTMSLKGTWTTRRLSRAQRVRTAGLRRCKPEP